MVATNRTHVSSLNNNVPGTTLAQQWQYAVLALHNAMKSAGFTVLASSDGATAGASDNVLLYTDCNSGIPGSAHTWIHYQAPAAMGNVETIIDCTDASWRELDFAGALAYNSDGTINNRPTATSAAQEWTSINFDFVPQTVFAVDSMSYHQTYASDGELVFGISINGSGACHTALWWAVLEDGDDATYPYTFYASWNVTTGGFSHLFMVQPGSFRTHHPPDGQDILNVQFVSPTVAMTGWPLGQSTVTSRVPICPVSMVVPTTGTLGRYVGRSQDHRAAPTFAPSALVEDGDTDTYRRVIWDNFWVVVEASELPIVF